MTIHYGTNSFFSFSAETTFGTKPNWKTGTRVFDEPYYRDGGRTPPVGLWPGPSIAQLRKINAMENLSRQLNVSIDEITVVISYRDFVLAGEKQEWRLVDEKMKKAGAPNGWWLTGTCDRIIDGPRVIFRWRAAASPLSSKALDAVSAIENKGRQIFDCEFIGSRNIYFPRPVGSR